MREKTLQATTTGLSALCSYILLFFISSFGGWIWEVLVYWWMHKTSVSIMELILQYRGVLHGPWAPIYGCGVITLAIIWKLFKGKTSVFLASILACGLLEYVSGWLLETLFHQRWWDYSGAFLSINGYICFVSVFGFGIAGATAILFLMPRYLDFLKKWSSKLLEGINCVLTALFTIDVAYSVTGLALR